MLSGLLVMIYAQEINQNSFKKTTLDNIGKSVAEDIETMYVDASYAVDPVRRRSITGYAICLGGGPIAWRSHLQSTIADSPNAAEYIGIHEAAVATMGINVPIVQQ